ncbi:hypothetical protein BOTBODRAFT_31272 [Botryobasidium botryosum FD-172 SS1]|uniref:Uncharacterized protein n=1 Tax=Botryobasidium botryosum (strain FD-172 SS1) TaxID=930990 RepID=A0A067MM45_BOTB1|nr:hypothetical protein BOTBODRAFT_31272 [Botryobasidium botryosum FD-172 SS1]
MPVEHFALHQYSNLEWSASTLISTLNHFPSVNSLFFRDCHPQFLHALTVTSLDQPCPGLRMLAIAEGTIPDDTLVSMARSRTKHSKDL